MTLAKLYNYLSSEGKAFFEPILGMTEEEYKQLNIEFSKIVDKTRSIPKEQRLIAVILIKRFKLTDTSIKHMIMPPDTSKTVFANFKAKVEVRLDTALATLPEIAKKLNQSPAPIFHSALVSQTYISFEDFFEKIVFAIDQGKSPDLILTHKARAMTAGWLEKYAGEPVTSKRKTGQQSFIQMVTCLMYDMDTFNTMDSYRIIYLSSVLNLYVHNASYAPMTGYGKAQQREVAHPLLYARSQGKHPHGLLFKHLTRDKQGAQCLLPKNEVLYKVLATEVKGSFTKNLEKYDQHGYQAGPKASKLAYFSLPFAYSGLRINAYSFTIKGLEYYLKSHKPADLIKRISEDFFLDEPTLNNVLKLSPTVLVNKVKYVHEVASELRMRMSERPYHFDLYLALTKFRRANAQQIWALSEKKAFSNIKVSYDLATNCLDVQFYPDKKIEENQNYSEGVTNVIINFFVGLLNHTLNLSGLTIKAHRRQSFAFNRITVTATTNMCMRVSLGYEPEIFITCFLQTLTVLNTILIEFNFLNRQDPNLSAGFEVVEKLRTEEANSSSGTQFLKAMRSTPNILAACEDAENSLNACYNKESYEQEAFKAYIAHIVSGSINTTPHKKLGTKLNKILKEGSKKDNILVIGLLNNILKFTLEKIKESEAINYHEEFIHSYSHILAKIIKLCHKAEYWLQHHTEFTSSHVYAKTLLLVDDLIENLVVLDSLFIAMQKESVDQLSYLSKLRDIEKSYTSKSLGIASKNIDVFFTDNGQQSLTASILCMTMQIFDPKGFRSLSDKIFTYEKCYFELFPNIKDNMDLVSSKEFNKAQFVLVDIREIDKFKKQYSKAAQAQIIVIDCTHNPCLGDSELNAISNQLLKDNKWVVIVGSMLKHEQLGMDKFQAGKLIVLSPNNMPLKENVRDELESITKVAVHPVTASYFTMISEICRDKIPVPTLNVGTIGLFKVGQNSHRSLAKAHSSITKC
ncbi:MAG: hypothetical protein WAW86_00015 [Gammaproteobacteria bacterium]